MRRAVRIFLVVLAVVLALVAFGYAFLSRLLSDLLWLKSTGYLSLFWKTALLKMCAFAVPFLVSLIIFRGWLFAVRGINKNPVLSVLLWVFSAGAGVLGLLNWPLLLMKPWGVAAGFADPFFRLDAYFYMAHLPLIRMALLLLSACFAVLFTLDLTLHRGGEKGLFRDGKLRFHFSTMTLFIITSLLALLFYFSGALEVLVSQPSARLGVDFKTFYGLFLGKSVWIGLAILYVLLLILRSVKGVSISGILVQTAVLAGLYFGLTRLYPWALESLHIRPNELSVQRPFAKNRIEATRHGFQLRFTEAYFPEYGGLDAGLRTVLSTLRIWDNDPYLSVIRQVQTIKTYFDFHDVDLGAYRVRPASGREGDALRQVVISARELSTASLSPDAITWDNLHLRYTHGNGAVVSPAHLADSEGSPVFWLGDLDQPAAQTNLSLTRPQIYFGELTSNYVIVNTTADEFSYTASTNRVTTRYGLDRGIKLDSLFKKILFSVVFGEKNIFLSKYITKDSAILYRREIQERVRSIFPRLKYDPDPYPVILDGRIVWVIDAYTVSDRFPIAEKYDSILGRINYLRCSVKVTVDAYSGDVSFYRVDDSDPVAAAYDWLFPGLFQKEVPAALEEHFRYPYHMLKIQSAVLGKYHVDNEDSFYNGDDVWVIPNQVYGDKAVPFEPYYLISLFETNRTGTLTNCLERFSLVQPFAPRNRDNLASWVLAWYDNGPRLALQYGGHTSAALGPMQVEARINQDDRMSSFFTLWGQKGSKTFRGNVKFIPLNGRLLYSEPIFLESVSMSMPQLVKIVSIYDGALYLGNNYDQLRNMMLKTGPGADSGQ